MTKTLHDLIRELEDKRAKYRALMNLCSKEIHKLRVRAARDPSIKVLKPGVKSFHERESELLSEVENND